MSQLIKLMACTLAVLATAAGAMAIPTQAGAPLFSGGRTVPAAGSVKAPSHPSEEASLRGDIEARRLLGFRHDRDYVKQLRNSPQDVGSADFGIPMTAAEREEWNRRAQVMKTFDERLAPAVHTRDDFAGLYVDQPAGDKIVILTTGDPDTVLKELLAIDPRLAGDLRVRHTEVIQAELGQAARDLFTQRKTYFPKITVHTTGVGVPPTSVVVTVPRGQVDAARAGAKKASQALGVPVRGAVSTGDS